MEDVVVGDWISFYRNGDMIIAIVQYGPKYDVLGVAHFDTNLGRIRADSILERRRDGVISANV